MSESGYEQKRFVEPVRQSLVCCFCFDVPRNPRCCEEEHPFCDACIKRYIQECTEDSNRRPECPTCRRDLTQETLKAPSRYFMEIWSELKITCDYIERGCSKHVQLAKLQDHVKHCGYAPITCEKCEAPVNRKDLDTHQKSLCALDGAMSAEGPGDTETEKELTKSEDNPVKLEQSNPKKIDIAGMAKKQEENSVKLQQIRAAGNQIMGNLSEVKQMQGNMEDNLNEVKNDVGELNQHFDRVVGMLSHLLQESSFNKTATQTVHPGFPANDRDIIILGGRYGTSEHLVLNTVEKYNIGEKRSTMLPPMHYRLVESASCVYNNEILVAGGYDGDDCTAAIQVLKMNQPPLRWTIFDGELPTKLSSHDVVIYEDQLITVGGYNADEDRISDSIFQTALKPPYISQPLARMPQRRRDHRAEIVNGKLFILGGSTTRSCEDTIASVIAYDFVKKEFTSCPSLPHPIWCMSTVTYGNMIIVLGGEDDDQVLNKVTAYNTETGQSEALPPMIYKRRDCSAVIVNDVIVVLGGGNAEQEHLNSVETLTIGGDRWEELPGMIERRYNATAVVIPRN